VAEGVETEVQLAMLAAKGCDEMQGYYYARPMPAADCASRARPWEMFRSPSRCLSLEHTPATDGYDRGQQVLVEGCLT
jgi:hypothetical protein